MCARRFGGPVVVARRLVARTLTRQQRRRRRHRETSQMLTSKLALCAARAANGAILCRSVPFGGAMPAGRQVGGQVLFVVANKTSLGGGPAGRETKQKCQLCAPPAVGLLWSALVCSGLLWSVCNLPALAPALCCWFSARSSPKQLNELGREPPK